MAQISYVAVLQMLLFYLVELVCIYIFFKDTSFKNTP